MIRALYDANVLYPAPLRDLLMRLAVSKLVHACWTDEIHAEWMNNLLQDRPDLKRDRLERTRQKMDAHNNESLIKGYEHLIPTLELPDPKDRHVLAAAIHARAAFIVTFNLKDFPKHALHRHGIEAILPDDFVVKLIASNPTHVLNAVKLQRAGLRNPPNTVEEHLETLKIQRLSKTVTFLREHQNEI